MKYLLSIVVVLAFMVFPQIKAEGHNGVDHSLPENAAIVHEEQASASHSESHSSKRYREYIIMGAGLIAGAYIVKKDKGEKSLA